MKMLLRVSLVLVMAAVIGIAPSTVAVAENEASNFYDLNMPVPLERAGTFVGWGKEGNEKEGDPLRLPTELADVALRKVAYTSSTAIGLTGDGRVVAWGKDGQTNVIPKEIAALRNVADIATDSNNAGVVTSDGKVHVWGASASGVGDPTDVPANLDGVKQLAIAHTAAFALKHDGTVVSWGRKGEFDIDTGILSVPSNLKATAISAAQFNAYALTTDGTVEGWGNWSGDHNKPNPPLPPETQIKGNVLAVAAVNSGGVALLADHTITSWGWDFVVATPPDFDGKKIFGIAGGGGLGGCYVALDEDANLHIVGGCGPDNPLFTTPTQLEGAPITQITTASSRFGVIVPKMLRAELPEITGTAQAGSGVLTGTPGTFSDAPDQVTNQWIVNGKVITHSSNKLPLSGYAAGTKIIYRSTAAKAGEDAVVSDSEAVELRAAPAPISPPAPKTKTNPTVVARVNKAPTRKKPGQVRVRVQGGPTATGTVRVVMRGKLVKPKLKKRLQRLKKQRKQVATAKRRKNIVKKIKKIRRKANKPKRIIVAKKLNKNGAAKVRLKKLARGKGRWTVRVAYRGDATHTAAKSKAVKFKVKKR